MCYLFREAHDLKLSDLMGASPRAKGQSAPAKYANPDNAAETWSGQGGDRLG